MRETKEDTICRLGKAAGLSQETIAETIKKSGIRASRGGPMRSARTLSKAEREALIAELRRDIAADDGGNSSLVILSRKRRMQAELRPAYVSARSK